MCKSNIVRCEKCGIIYKRNTIPNRKEVIKTGYVGYNDAKKASNKKYMDKLARVVLWVSPEEKKEIEERARADGKSVNQYVKEKVLS